MSSINSITAEKLARLIGAPKYPALIDVRADDEFAADPRLIPGAARRRLATLYDAFYRWRRDATNETHNWPTNKKGA